MPGWQYHELTLLSDSTNLRHRRVLCSPYPPISSPPGQPIGPLLSRRADKTMLITRESQPALSPSLWQIIFKRSLKMLTCIQAKTFISLFLTHVIVLNTKNDFSFCNHQWHSLVRKTVAPSGQTFDCLRQVFYFEIFSYLNLKKCQLLPFPFIILPSPHF